MSIKLFTEGIWSELTGAVKKSKIKALAAVAYFGKNGAAMLPLPKGSILVVDASELTVTKGLTCPDELLKLYYKGVKIFSKDNLHAKIFVVGRTLYVGSTNVSQNSKNYYQEAILNTTDRKAISDAKEFFQTKCLTLELGENELLRLKKMYNPPKDFKNSNRSKKSFQKQISFHIYHLETVNYSDEEKKQSKQGKIDAARKFQNVSRHVSDEFLCTNALKAKLGDIILQITREGDQVYVSPPGRLYHIRKWSNGKKIKQLCYVEVPMRRRKNIERIKKNLSTEEIKMLDRDGRRSNTFGVKINSFWK